VTRVVAAARGATFVAEEKKMETTTTGRGNESIDALNDLLRGELASVETYRQALEKVTDVKLRPTLEENRRLHAQRCDLLKNRVLQLGGKPAHTTGVWGAFIKLLEGGAKLFGVKAAIAVLEEGEDKALRDYRSCVDKLDAENRQFVETQLLAGQEETHRAMSTMKHTLH
jgi:uncharacterized protein (TIGR02284 family)